MSFFKKYNGTVNKRLARLSALVGFFMQRDGDNNGGEWLIWAGAVVAVVGFMLIVVRARLREDPDPKDTAARRRD
jgi:cytochrome c-type biogenesis protein CcmH/NrfF